MQTIHFTYEKPDINDDLLSLYNLSFVESPRPTQDKEKIMAMFDHATIVCCAYDQDKLIGVCRALSDFTYTTYISDLAVLNDYQNQSIGTKLIAMVKEKSGPDCKLVLLSNTTANTFYPHIGFTSHDRAWVKN